MDQRIINLYDEYTHKPLTREDFIRKLIQLTGSTAAAMAVLPLIEVNYAHAATIPQQDERLFTEYITYPGQGGDVMQAYVARPRKNGRYPGVMIIHENRGLNPHIEDVTRKMALEGFLAFAPNALAPLGGTPDDADKARELFQQLDAEKTLHNFILGFDYVKTRKDCNGRLGCVGFCWGGAMANNLAIHVPDLRAAVSYYGRQPELSAVPKIKAALLLHYAGLDERINAGIPAYEEALKKAGVRYAIYVYEGAQHAFNNNTSPARYNAEAAQLAWERTINFLREHLK
jgi:carboxymethylenebutenolidase